MMKSHRCFARRLLQKAVLVVVVVCWCLFVFNVALSQSAPTTEPLRISISNPRYFTDRGGKAIYLTGSHTWNNRQDFDTTVFDYMAYLNFLVGHNHNFIRLYVWEEAKGLQDSNVRPGSRINPTIYARTGPGRAKDGSLKFNVNQFNEELTRKIDVATSQLATQNEELRLLNEALFKSQRELSQSEKLAAVGQVTATMAHQIGTPLNSISGYIQLMLQEGNLQPKDRDRLKIIDSQLDRLAESVKNLLSFTQQPKPELKPLNVNELLEELIHLSEPWLHTRNVKLFSYLSPHGSLILGDSTHLQTLFFNLITNAIDAMPQGGLLTIKTQEAPSQSFSENGEWVEISITDTGIGITEESKKRIFDPFFTTRKMGEGTGLGLSICEKIVKEHSGKLTVISEVGKGSTFFVIIPIFQRDGIDAQTIR